MKIELTKTQIIILDELLSDYLKDNYDIPESAEYKEVAKLLEQIIKKTK